jgi:hypothetical protein
MQPPARPRAAARRRAGEVQRRREVWFLGRVQKAHIDRAGRNDSVERLRAGARGRHKHGRRAARCQLQTTSRRGAGRDRAAADVNDAGTQVLHEDAIDIRRAAGRRY